MIHENLRFVRGKNYQDNSVEISTILQEQISLQTFRLPNVKIKPVGIIEHISIDIHGWDHGFFINYWDSSKQKDMR